MLSPKQREVVNHWFGNQRMMVAVGAIRSGKTFSAADSLARFLISDAAPHDFALVGVTQDAVWRNVGRPLMGHLRRLETPAYEDRQHGLRIRAGAGRSVWLIGCNDEGARRRLQGMTLRGLLVDEAALIPEDAWVMATSRCSVSGAKIWATLNPESPGHWFRRQVIQRLEHWRARLVDFRLRDNPTLTEATIADYEAAYTGHQRARLIHGQWAGASGLIFPTWRTGTAPAKVDRYLLGVDWAGSGVFAAVMLALDAERRGCIVAERVYDARVQEPLTDAEQVDRTAKWAAAITDRPLAVYGDPSTPGGAKREFARRRIRWRDANNKVNEGISVTGSALAEGRITIAEGCEHLRQEILEYAWDKAAQNRGEDRPVKAADHAADALRYVVTGAIQRRDAVIL